jgi:hypothetical protein
MYILRQMTDFEGEGEHGESGGHEAEAGGEEGEEGGEEGEEGEDAQDMVDVEDGNATVHMKPFSRFPPLEHHAHPFLVIHNALPKLRKHMLLLCPEHLTLLTLMSDIEAIWLSRLSKAPLSSKLGKRTMNSLTTMTHPVTDPNTKPEGPRNEATPSSLALIKLIKFRKKSSTVDPLHTKVFLFDDILEVSAWAAGPPEVMPVDEAVIWSDEEPVRSPIQHWDRWHVPYKQPKQRARFCSSDWPMHFYSFPLWMPSYK